MLYLGFRLWDFSDSGSKVGVLRECRVCIASTRELGKWLESGLSSSRQCWPKCRGAHQFDALLVGSNKYPELAGCYCARALKSPKPLNPARHLFLFLPYPYSYSYVYAYSSLLALLLLFSFVLLLCVCLVLYVLLLLVLYYYYCCITFSYNYYVYWYYLIQPKARPVLNQWIPRASDQAPPGNCCPESGIVLGSRYWL